MIRFFACVTVFALSGIWTHGASAQTDDDIAGRVVGLTAAGPVDMPLLKSDLKVDIQGDMATVQVRQVFANPSDLPMSAEYLFPLNQNAAVYAMEMQVGDEVVAAQIQRKAEAEQTFEDAEQEGKAAALLTQHRPNMFTQNIANLMPGQPISVTLSYVQAVPKVDGAYELVLPLVVGPRYQGVVPQPDDPGDPFLVEFSTDDTRPKTTQSGGWLVSDLPTYPPVSGLAIPDMIDPERVSLDLSLAAAVPISSFTSATHELNVTESDDGVSADFLDGREIDNRDVILRYELGAEDTTAGILSHYDERGGFVSLMIEPPELPEADQIAARELVFVLDTSGSMSGAPLNASKRFMKAALQGLRPEDYFRVIRFSSSASEFATEAVLATRQNIAAGQRFVRSLSASGGTEIDNAMRYAFETRQPADTLRIVVFLSDGYIGNEAGVLHRIRRQIGDARIYAFGVGTSVNRYLLDAMADEGRGFARYVDPTEDASDVAETLARDLKSPVLTDIAIDWGGLKVTDVVPQRIPDLFDGGSVRVLARYEGGGSADVQVNGMVQGRNASMPLKVDLPTEPTEASAASRGAAIPLTWARNKIADLDRAIAVQDGDEQHLEERIAELGLLFNLQTRYTSFVAVSKAVVNDSGIPASKTAVPLPQVAGVSAHAYPNTGFSGSSAPEPQTIFGIITLMALGALRLSRTRRKAV
ncbi:VIT and VWA domain-containing protein [Ruegeria sp. R14_0]|uniref:VIT and vWA domain-containing protein n=1 Tax=Ruegeria sp. R14_0 TaxID=2821100 RepID=UPI001ADC8566|nr:VIT and VWA domain-containing protein [Ruegeria sp. R14_0]MBO9447551.1 VWA domain-containing protein [Ruegeria sp. R14_0]